MISRFNNVLVVCALCCCALVNPAQADESVGQSAANQKAPAVESDNRMQHLAERLAEPSGSGDPESAGRETNLRDTSDTSAGVNPSSSLTRTPLFRSGDLLDGVAESERPGSSSWFLQTFTALGIVIGLALCVRYVYARMGGKVSSYASPVVEVLSRTTVAPRSHVMLLRVGGRVLVVSDSSAGMRTLASLEDPQEVADILGAVSSAKPTSISRGFSQLLHRFTDDHESQGDGLDEALADTTDKPDKTRDSVTSLLSRVRSMGRQGGTP